MPMGLLETGAPLWAFIAAFWAVMITGDQYIAFLRNRYLGQYIREDGPQSHQSKAGTPTMGGVLIAFGVLVGTIVLGLLRGFENLSTEVWLVLGVGFVFALMGGSDDFLKIAKKKNKGLSGYSKLAIQVVAGLLLGFYMMSQGKTEIFFWHFGPWQLGWLYPIFAAFIVTGASNAVNLTDGLDGLATSTSILAFVAVMTIMPLVGHVELSWLAWILTGACLGFFFFNRHPARVFMGDTGSLALGGVLGAMMLLSGQGLMLALVGGIFVIEALSVIAQVLSFKSTGKRIFKMAPLHHHFELCGLTETRVVYFFAGVQFIFCSVAVWLTYNR